MKQPPSKNVDEYLDAVPPQVRTTLEKIRSTIKAAAPGAEEVISYGIPSYKYKGMLVGFAAFRDHCSFFLMGTELMKVLQEELKSYDTTKGTIHFALDKPLPAALVKKIVKAKVEENEARFSAKKSSKAYSRKSKKKT